MWEGHRIKMHTTLRRTCIVECNMKSCCEKILDQAVVLVYGLFPVQKNFFFSSRFLPDGDITVLDTYTDWYEHAQLKNVAFLLLRYIHATLQWEIFMTSVIWAWWSSIYYLTCPPPHCRQVAMSRRVCGMSSNSLSYNLCFGFMWYLYDNHH